MSPRRPENAVAVDQLQDGMRNWPDIGVNFGWMFVPFHSSLTCVLTSSKPSIFSRSAPTLRLVGSLHTDLEEEGKSRAGVTQTWAQGLALFVPAASPEQLITSLCLAFLISKWLWEFLSHRGFQRLTKWDYARKDFVRCLVHAKCSLNNVKHELLPLANPPPSPQYSSNCCSPCLHLVTPVVNLDFVIPPNLSLLFLPNLIQTPPRISL